MPISPAQVITVPDFFSRADELRAVFDDVLGTPRALDRRRFVWDYWHVPGQYTYLRTQAKWFFPAGLLSDFLAALRDWGEQRVGCRVVGDPWLSCYVDGCRQELHTDATHGPWAYTYSLTRWSERRFDGGETMLLDRAALDDGRAGAHEHATLFAQVEPHFNQLTVFDPRIPHGVRTVEGTRDPLAARIAIHGWLRRPL